MELLVFWGVSGAIALLLLARFVFLESPNPDVEVEPPWTAVGAELGFRRNPNSPWLEGEFAGSVIRIITELDSDTQQSLMSIVIDRSNSSLKLIRIESEGMLGFLRKRTPGEGVIIGDSAFDSAFLVAGPEALLLALLDEPCRAQLLALRRDGGATLQGGRLAFSLRYEETLFDVRNNLRRAISLARALRIEDAEIADRLATNARGSDQPQVRLRNLQSLARLPNCAERAREVALQLLDDPDPDIRLAVASRLGTQELEALLALVSREHDARVLVPLFEQLATFAGERLWPAIQQALRSHQESVRRVAVEAASATSYTGLAPRIAQELEGSMATAQPETLVALADALRTLRDPTTEAELMNLLTHESKAVQRAAALALGEFGSVAAIEPLLTSSNKLLLGGETKAAILTAITRIQSRIGHVEAGALSLVNHDDHSGAVSLAEDTAQGGALSLVDSSLASKASE